MESATERGETVTVNVGSLGTLGSLPSSFYYNIAPVKPKTRPIRIKQLDEGFVVKVGCKSFAVADANALITHLTAYINDPSGVEQAYDKGEYSIK